MLVGLPLANGARCFEPVHYGHLHIHQHQVIVTGGAAGDDAFDRQFAIARDVEYEPRVFEVSLDQEQIVVAVLGDQDAKRPVALGHRCFR